MTPTTITITDPALLALFHDARGPVEVRAPDGDYLGKFQPPDGKPPAGFVSPFTDEELAERRKDRTGRPLKDIIRDLEARGDAT